MLILIVVVLIILVCFINNSDADIVAYTWGLLGKGLNVYVAVMLFMVLVRFLRILSGRWPWLGARPWILYLLIAIDMRLLMFVLLAITRMYPWKEDCALPPAKRHHTGAVDYTNITERVVHSMTFGNVLSHLIAFSWMLFWAEVQLKLYEATRFDHGRWCSIGSVAAVLPVAFMVQLAMLVVFRILRIKWTKRDNHIDVDETLWLETCMEIDIEAGALQLSFLTVQIIHFIVSDQMPDHWGNEGGKVHTWQETSWMFLAAFLAMASHVALSLGTRHSDATDEDKVCIDESLPYSKLFEWVGLELVLQAQIFLCGWALLTSFRWSVRNWVPHTGHVDIMLVRAFVALLCSILSFMIIFFLDKFLDSAKVNLSIGGQRAGEGVIAMVGMMMGFAWERCFHHAFEITVHSVVIYSASAMGIEEDDSLTDRMTVATALLLMTGILSTVTLYVMYWYIVPRVLESQLFKDHLDEEKTKGEVEDALLSNPQKSVDQDSDISDANGRTVENGIPEKFASGVDVSKLPVADGVAEKAAVQAVEEAAKQSREEQRATPGNLGGEAARANTSSLLAGMPFPTPKARGPAPGLQQAPMYSQPWALQYPGPPADAWPQPPTAYAWGQQQPGPPPGFPFAQPPPPWMREGPFRPPEGH